MIVAVLGANGQLGSDIVRATAEAQDGLKPLALTRSNLDVSDLPSISAVLSKCDFDVLVNCTSYHKTDEVEAHATEAFRINAHAVAAMAKACKSRGARFVHISTDYVFDGASERPYKETDPPNPLNVYGASKLLGENLAMREYGNGTIIARVASLFGVAGSSGKGGNFVETILRKAKETGEVRVVNDVTMSPTYTAEAARILLSLIVKHAPAGIYHVVNSGQATWFEFARQAIEDADVKASVLRSKTSDYPGAVARPIYTVLNNQKVARLVGEIPHWRFSLDNYLSATGHLGLASSSAAS